MYCRNGKSLHDRSELRDAGGSESDADGLGLLPLHTTFGPNKLTDRVDVHFGTLRAPWAALSHLPVRGYEIRQGRTRATAPIHEALPGDRGWVHGSALGISVHGVLEDPSILRALLGASPERTLDTALDDLTDAVMADLDVAAVEAMVEL